MKTLKFFFKSILIYTAILLLIQSKSFPQVLWQQVYSSTAIVHCMAKQGNIIYAGTLGNGFIKSNDNGINWNPSNNGLTVLNIYAIAFSGNNIFVGAGALLGSSGGVFISTDSGNNWTSTGLTNKNVRCLAISGNNIFAGTKGAGIFLSTDNGTTWNEVNDGLSNLTIAAIAIKGSFIFAGTSDGVFRSTNNGVSWSLANSGLTYLNTSCFLVSGSNLFAGTKGGGVFLSTSDGTSWNNVNTGLSDLVIYGFESSSNNVFVGTSKGVAFTADNGTGWIGKGLIFYTVNSILSTEQYIFAGSSIGIHKLELSQAVLPLELIKPIGGEIWQSTSQQLIIWKTTGIANVKLEYTTNNGSNWLTIIASIPATTSNFSWVIPVVQSSECKIKISDVINQDIFINSTNKFTISVNLDYDFISANEVKMWIGNNGDGSHNPITDGGGFLWPGGINATKEAIFEDGLVWGCKVYGQIRVNGNTHRQGLMPGKILSPGVADNPADPKYLIWKLKKNWPSLPSPERERYEYNYFNWPGELGAPYIDVNKDGIFTKGIDLPYVIGDETLFFVANDLDSARTAFTYGSPPIGIEVQITTYAYNRTDELKDVVFKKYKIINKSSYTLNDMYLSYWADPDLGTASDDFSGCDSLLNLGYAYNGVENDPIYGSPPPAVGHLFLQGPMSPGNPTDSAIFNGKWRKGYKNLPMTSYNFYSCGLSPQYCIPTQGVYTGTIEAYFNMQGLIKDGTPYINPLTNKTTKFPINGDPATGTGWYEGLGWPGGFNPGDRYYLINSGSFSLAPNDSQEVVIAILIAKGTDRLNSVTKLKQKAQITKDFYLNAILTSTEKQETIPSKYELSQNYPNPFNSQTKIIFRIPKSARSTLKLYDILGKEIATLINEIKQPGEYYVELNSDKFNLPSGIYFYQLRAGEFLKTMKMILMK